MNDMKTEGLLKISEVARLADISVSTVKYYVKEGLVDIACKTGRNMAYYKPDSVERVKLIKTLQNEKYYPLSVIKRIISSGGVDRSEDELLYTISKVDEADYYELMPLSEAAKEAGLKPGQVEKIVKAGVINPTGSGRARQCTHGELRVMKLIKRRLDAKIPLEQTLKTFLMFESRLTESARMDIESLMSQGMLCKKLSTRDIVNIINVSDETLDSYISMKRYAINATLGAEYIAKAEIMLLSLRLFGQRLAVLLQGQGRMEESSRVIAAIRGEKTGSEILKYFGAVLALSGKGIAKTLGVLYSANEQFKQPKSELDCAEWAVCVAWRALIPPQFGFDGAGLSQPTGEEEICAKVLRMLNELQDEI